MRNGIDLGVFWKTFEQILIENGEPFKIVYKDHYADVNRYKINLNIDVDISLVRRDNFLRVGLYIIDKYSDIGRIILANKEQINKQLTFSPLWESGEKNPDTLRVIVKLPIDNFTCRELIEQALPYIMEFIAVAKKYGEQFFFDF